MAVSFSTCSCGFVYLGVNRQLGDDTVSSEFNFVLIMNNCPTFYINMILMCLQNQANSNATAFAKKNTVEVRLLKSKTIRE